MTRFLGQNGRDHGHRANLLPAPQRTRALPGNIMPALTLKVFISSPGDVGQERILARRVLERLEGAFGGFVELEPILWEHEPLRATAHFQEQILPPSQTPTFR